MMDLEELERIKDLLAPGEDILVGVSGGVDSMVLLDILHRNRGFFCKDFKVLHVNHHISKHSDSWARFVADHCESLGVRYEIADVDVAGYGNNLEHAARQARYAAFAERSADMLVLAHHANDQIETFFLKLFRGSGLKGLRCMKDSAPSWVDPDVRLVRPLLAWGRDQILDYAERYGVPNIEDESNGDTRFNRNWIRHELWPLISDRNEIADVNLLRSIALIEESWSLTQDLAQIDLESCSTSNGQLDWTKVRQLSMPRLKNLILHLLDQDNVTGFSTHHVEEFSRSLLNADMDSRNEMRVKGFTMRKLGKKIAYGTAV
jgi:tRNA(Ile)-lysidine synthase